MKESYYQRHKDIIKERAKIWKKNNRDKVLLSNKKYKSKNKNKIAVYEKLRQQRPEVKEKLRANALNHYYRNKAKQLERMKIFREENKDWFKNYRKENLDKRAKYQKQYFNKSLNNKIMHRLRTRLNIALNNYTKTGKIKSSDKYGIDYNAIIEHLKPFPEDISKYHIDHIKPLCLFDLTNSEEVKKAFAPENHQWLLKEDNLSKGCKF